MKRWLFNIAAGASLLAGHFDRAGMDSQRAPSRRLVYYFPGNITRKTTIYFIFLRGAIYWRQDTTQLTPQRPVHPEVAELWKRSWLEHGSAPDQSGSEQLWFHESRTLRSTKYSVEISTWMLIP